jgi:hypothetical protein
MKSSRHNGIASALGAALLFGASTPLAKLAVSSASAVMIADLLYLGSGVGLAVLGRIRSVAGVRQTETPLVGKGPCRGWRGPSLRAAWPDPYFFCWLIKNPSSARVLLLNLAVATGLCMGHLRENVDNALAQDSRL